MAGATRGDGAAGRSRGFWTLVGLAAVPMWAMFPALTVAASGLPSFQIVAAAHVVGCLFLIALGRGGFAARWDRARVVTTLACALGLVGSSAGFLIAAQRIPPETANLISYLWPVWLALIAGALGLLRLRWTHAVALALGFSGAAAAIGAGEGVDALGVGVALLAGLSWAVFCVVRMGVGAAAGDVLAPGCAIAAVVGGAIHLAVETTAAPTAAAAAAVAATGMGPLALGNTAWDLGMRRGDGRVLAVGAYATPVASALVLVALGLAAPSYGLAAGAALIVAAGAAAARAG
jgi:drug/metabolite transporter (DMT)-like permease